MNDEPGLPREDGAATAAPHPEEMRARAEVRVGRSVSATASFRATPAGLVAVGILTSGILLAVAAIICAARSRGPVLDSAILRLPPRRA